jgi:hypothetical protein
MDKDVAGLVERLEQRALVTRGLKRRHKDYDAETDEAAASTIRALVAENEQWRVDFNECYADLGSAITKLREAVEVIRGSEIRDSDFDARLKWWKRREAFLATMEKPHD